MAQSFVNFCFVGISLYTHLLSLYQFQQILVNRYIYNVLVVSELPVFELRSQCESESMSSLIGSF